MHRPGVTGTLLAAPSSLHPSPKKLRRTESRTELVDVRGELPMGSIPGPAAASAGCLGVGQMPGLLQLDQDALYKVLARLEPQALATAGATKHSSACVPVSRRACARGATWRRLLFMCPRELP